MATARPVHAMDLYAERFGAFTRQKELRLQQCSACGKFRWRPGPTCDRCLAEDFEWSALSGTARVPSWTTLRRGYFEESPPPHTVVALALEEGPLFVSYPVGIDAAELREGMRLQLRWTDGADRFGEYNLPVFGPPPSLGTRLLVCSHADKRCREKRTLGWTHNLLAVFHAFVPVGVVGGMLAPARTARGTGRVPGGSAAARSRGPA